jgi:uncharacterized protein
VIVLDANLLIYAYRFSSPDHVRAREWVEGILSGDELIGLRWQTISAFARILTNPNLGGDRFSTAEIVSIIQEWIELPNVRLLSPGERHWSVFQRVLLEGQVRGPMITDAQLAALTIEYGGVLHTADRDFSRFHGLRWANPLVQE